MYQSARNFLKTLFLSREAQRNITISIKRKWQRFIMSSSPSLAESVMHSAYSIFETNRDSFIKISIRYQVPSWLWLRQKYFPKGLSLPVPNFPPRRFRLIQYITRYSFSCILYSRYIPTPEDSQYLSWICKIFYLQRVHFETFPPSFVSTVMIRKNYFL